MRIVRGEKRADKPRRIPTAVIHQVLRHVMDQRIVRLQPGFDNKLSRGRKRRLLDVVGIVARSKDEIAKALDRRDYVVCGGAVVRPPKVHIRRAWVERNRHLLKDPIGGDKPRWLASRAIGPKAAGKGVWIGGLEARQRGPDFDHPVEMRQMYEVKDAVGRIPLG